MKPESAATADLEGCMTALAAGLGAPGIYTAPEDRARYENGARYGAGRAAFVARPASTAEVSLAVRICAQHGIRLVPQGANSGLVGASTPDASGLQGVLSLERLTASFELNAVNRSVRVSAGTRLSALNEALKESGLWFPIDLGADPTIGGMVATNTGGTRFIRYGDVRRNVLGLEVVTRDGTILDLMDGVRKNNAGLDAKQLFIGSSGRLGIVTQAILEVHPLPRDTATSLMVPSSDEAILEILVAMEDCFGPQLTSFEGMSGTALTCAFDHVPRLRNPFATDGIPDYALLMEISDWTKSNSDGAALQDRMEEALTGLFASGLISNAFMQGAQNLWAIRHHISDSLRSKGRVIALDVSVPRDRFVRFRVEASKAARAIEEQMIVADFGHVGDGGTHFNMIWPREIPYRADLAEALRVAVYEIVARHGGSFSAEHGVGPFNEHFYRRYVPAPKRELEARVAALLDPGLDAADRHAGCGSLSHSQDETER